ncbi:MULTISPECIES: hypothetical protein [Clostridium]|uniref:Comf operon protein A, DNA transporter ATPase n=4 Tax=Clostridium perfringens TaxID=1502 RepID=A0AAP7BVM4_CLOPF|nr:MULTISPECIES: hypothetical protein [Clostridium]ABG84249.1 hypothetical protein CPF_2432 [Clostridium perfringens ATCC 13124]ASY52437.1 hypothetical protein BG908_12405 [Clostridium perfringens]AWS26968.1 hypothetical protein CYK96_15405 [Clostridium perfringens]EDT23964.1 hypothetical protein AC1_2667 [Clostridium perfringens B str. ATCC 3626]EGT0682731.1 hypothetical protein [Clostridium perfringens]
MSLYGNNLRVENRYSHILKKWYVKSNDRFINLICEPYQKLNFIESLIGDCLINNEKVLYVGKSRKVCKNEQLNSMNFDFINFNNIFNIKKNFDLIIYDDVSLYSNKSSIECNEDLMYLKRLSKKIVICSVDKVFNNIKHIEILNNQRKTHFLEPRLITTRVNLETSMPYTLYDYIEWFIREKRILVVYVPNKFNLNKIYEYYTEDLNLENKVKIVKEDKKNSFLNIVNESRFKKEGIIFITDSLHEYFDSIPECDMVIYSFEKDIVDYKKIIFACGALCKDKCTGREVILLSNEEGDNIETARRLARGFNKTLWRESEIR